MGKISRIQLRGISRTPSDRLTTDGGCAESLNVSLDNTELAPAFVPDDVTGKLGLPDDLQAEKVFVHKTANYENVITAEQDKEDHLVSLYGWIGGTRQYICTLEANDDIKSMTSVGNTVIVTTSARPIYILFKDGKYSFLGDAIPMPTVEFFDKETPIDYDWEDPSNVMVYWDYPASLLENSNIEVIRSKEYKEEGGELNLNDDAVLGFTPSLWSRLDAEGNHEIEGAKRVVADMKALYDELKSKNSEIGILNSPVWVTFGVRLYDGTLKMSMPYLVSGGIETPVDIFAVSTQSRNYAYYILRINHYYQLGVRLHDYTEWEIKPWADIIKGIDVYMSEDINALDWKSMSLEKRKYNGDGKETYAKFKVSGLKGNYFEYAASCTTFSKVAEFAIDETFYKSGTPTIETIRQDYVIDMKGKILNEDRVGSLLSGEEHTFMWNTYKGNSVAYNKSLLYYDMSEVLSSGPTWLQSQRYNSHLPIPRVNTSLNPDYPAWWENSKFADESEMLATNYEITYYLKSELGEEAIVYGVSNGSYRFTMDYNRNKSEIKPIAFPLFMYADSRCIRIDITKDGRTITMATRPHQYLPNCSFAYADADLYWMFDGAVEKEKPAEKKNLNLSNKIALSKSENPLFFDSSSFYTFQSKVLGVAIATTALSQGQFGQFPLYVFTEDGIWAMETAADGSFVTSKPMSRDVCTNPASITSIDNAVVFVTDKGVMLLQGSQVVNISSYMNGKHYTIEETAKVILEKTIEETIAKISKTPVDQMAQVIQNEVSQSISQQETRASIERTAHSIIAEEEFFKDLLPILSDSTHFMAFIKDATIAYDYPGQRLIFIKKDEKYQYIYKLDSNTWHKTAYGLNLLNPINSYPECLVQGGLENAVRLMRVIANDSQEPLSVIANEIREVLPNVTNEEVQAFLDGELPLNVTSLRDTELEWLYIELNDTHRIYTETTEASATRIYDLSTILDAADSRIPTRGVIATRPFNLDAPDVLKTITDIKIRGQYARGAVKYILLGSMDGINFYVIGTKRGKAWKMFRLIILADLDPTERISWVDVVYEEKFTNRLR